MMTMAGDVDIGIFMRILSISALLFGYNVIAEQGGLYSESDSVHILTADNLNASLHYPKTAWIVEFYMSWCGHCINYAPTWNSFAKDVEPWSDVVKIGAIDCAQKENLAACRVYGLKGYPTILTFPAGASLEYRSEKFLGEKELWKLRHNTITELEKQIASSNSIMWPHLQVLESLENIWKEVTPQIKYTVVIFETPDSYTGREVMLDMSSHKNLLIRRMLKEHVKKFGIHVFPSMYLIDKEGTFEKLKENSDRAGFVSVLENLVGADNSEDLRFEENGAPGAGDGDGHIYVEDTDFPPAWKSQEKSREKVRMQDLESGLHYSLRQEIALMDVIEGPALEALKSYISVLAKYFPGSEVIVNFFKKMNNWIQDQTEPLGGEQWRDVLDNMETSSGHLPTTVLWTGCKGSSPKYRGYPCSLWTLFHTLTVNAVLDNGDAEDFDPLEVILAMKGYIHYFFGCKECSKHFIQRARDVELKVRSPMDSVLWLWVTHNKANKALKGDEGEDPAHPKVQFPPFALCPECYQSDVYNGTNIPWVDSNVYNFLIDLYGRDNIVKDNHPYTFVPHLHSNKRTDQGEALKSKGETLIEEVNGVDYIQDSPSESRSDGHDREKDLKEFKERKSHKFQGGTRDLSETKLDEKRSHKLKKMKDFELETRITGHSFRNSLGIGTIDISLCVLLYCLGTGILLLLYFHFTMRKRRNARNSIKKYPV